MLTIRNGGNQPILVGETYLFPTETRGVSPEEARRNMAKYPEHLQLVGSPDLAQSFSHNEGLLEKDQNPPSDLTQIKGIGQRAEQALNACQVYSFADLAHADPDDLAGRLDGIGGRQVRDWQEQARMLMSETGSET